ncbi:Clavaminate synthase-like protein [Pseudovirgaria hyperparasitica]|uniref:Clavaminate synthase-like protein n=1 Tax=Pseudovirgaria hyperparasitica TaxID=470096 RepID=A0A6A6VTV4_9PEZI|nr:Clavaminate synthase-like protein [Pseudovirgaria hyperparasitica]KAF2753575.1 Clavaminate synthase-like protein [Pseudovirgaria hyperparasitica]
MTQYDRLVRSFRALRRIAKHASSPIGIWGNKTSTRPQSSYSIPHLRVDPNVKPIAPKHVAEIHQILESCGISKVTLAYADPESDFLKHLILNLNKHFQHGPPITHSSSRGWFWDVRPTSASLEADSQKARSETMESFPWHTDCSYEACPPRFFALHVLQPDRCGGGNLSVLDVDQAVRLLPKQTQDQLLRPEFEIAVPEEFCKGGESRVTGSLLGNGSGEAAFQLRYRDDIVRPLTKGAALALEELRQLLQSAAVKPLVLQLTPVLLPAGSVILIDNRRWLHARDQVKDPDRHLRRVRWDARPF